MNQFVSNCKEKKNGQHFNYFLMHLTNGAVLVIRIIAKYWHKSIIMYFQCLNAFECADCRVTLD